MKSQSKTVIGQRGLRPPLHTKALYAGPSGSSRVFALCTIAIHGWCVLATNSTTEARCCRQCPTHSLACAAEGRQRKRGALSSSRRAINAWYPLPEAMLLAVITISCSPAHLSTAASTHGRNSHSCWGWYTSLESASTPFASIDAPGAQMTRGATHASKHSRHTILRSARRGA